MKLCTLCAKENNTVMMQIKNIFICKDCVDLMHKGLSDLNFDSEDKNSEILVKEDINSMLKPSQINNLLDEYVIEQEIAKDKLSVAIYNHQKMLRYKEKHGESAPVDIEKSNVLMVGPTGSGKTYLIKTLAKKLGIPLAIQDATNLTAAGYVGDDVENCLRKLIEAADYDMEKASKGIIYIDEIDKICRRNIEGRSNSRDVSGEGVQQALLRIVEGTIAEIPPKGGRKNPTQETIKLDTTNILFIIGGSFEGIEKMIAKRKQGKSSMGFGATVVDSTKLEFNEYIHNVETEDLKKFGMLPEFLGRFPIISTLDELSEKALLKILTEPKNALIKQYSILFEEDDIRLTFTDEAIKKIANKAMKSKTGARGLRKILDELLLDVMHSSPDENLSEVIIDDELNIIKIENERAKAL